MDPFICDAIAGNNEDLEMTFRKAITCWMAGLVIGAIAIIMQLGDGK